MSHYRAVINAPKLGVFEITGDGVTGIVEVRELPTNRVLRIERWCNEPRFHVGALNGCGEVKSYRDDPAAVDLAAIEPALKTAREVASRAVFEPIRVRDAGNGEPILVVEARDRPTLAPKLEIWVAEYGVQVHAHQADDLSRDVARKAFAKALDCLAYVQNWVDNDQL